MKLLVTGASGFLGKCVVAEAAERGHAVVAMVRSPTDFPQPNVQTVIADLRSRKNLVESLTGCEAVLHLAAAKSGDLYTQLAGTVVATENLLWAMDQASVGRLVHVSSFSVYDYLNMPGHTLLDETAPLADPFGDRDDYAITKILQERLVIDHAKKNNWRWTVLRPGMLYGRGNLFNARVGQKMGNNWLRTGGWARIPLNYVENCAQAILLAAESPLADGQIFNCLDDNPPTQRQYAKLIAARTTPRPKIIPVPWTVMRTLARSIAIFNRLFLGGRAKIPGVLIPSRLHARCKPLRYSNEKIKSVLNWSPRYDLHSALDRSVASPAAPAFTADSAGAARPVAGGAA
jgi:nucleoside-diphosphate-sugar epimerase